MEMTSTRAQLVGTRDLDRERAAVTATIPRAEIEEAVSSAEQPELLLEVDRRGEADGHGAVSVAWDRADLEHLLDETPGEAITFSFEEEELLRALEPDVEGHGMRERAIVLTVAAAAAAGAGSAFAANDPGGASGGGSAAAPTIVSPSHDESGAAARGIVPAGTHDEAVLADRGIQPAASSTTHDEANLVARGIVEPSSTGHDEATLASRGIDPQPVPGDDGGFAIDVPSAGTAAIVGGAAGGLALLITAAGFAARRDRVRPV